MKVRFVIEDSKGQTIELSWDEMMRLLKKLQNLSYKQLEQKSFTFKYTPDNITVPDDTGMKRVDPEWSVNKDDDLRWKPADHKYFSS